MRMFVSCCIKFVYCVSCVGCAPAAQSVRLLSVVASTDWGVKMDINGGSRDNGGSKMAGAAMAGALTGARD